MMRTVTFFALALLAASSCAPSSTYQKDSTTGFCFKAEGVRTARCHAEMAACLRSESTLHDQYPYATIESTCHRHSLGQLDTSQVAESFAETYNP